MNHRDEYGMEPRVPEAFKDYILTLDSLDSHVYEFGRGCDEGQQSFVDFVMEKVLAPYEWQEIVRVRNFQKFCERWERYERRALDNRYLSCTYGYEAVMDDEEDFEWPFCVNCGKKEEDHCTCGDCSGVGQTHLQWALDRHLVRYA